MKMGTFTVLAYIVQSNIIITALSTSDCLDPMLPSQFLNPILMPVNIDSLICVCTVAKGRLKRGSTSIAEAMLKVNLYNTCDRSCNIIYIL